MQQCRTKGKDTKLNMLFNQLEKDEDGTRILGEENIDSVDDLKNYFVNTLVSNFQYDTNIYIDNDEVLAILKEIVMSMEKK